MKYSKSWVYVVVGKRLVMRGFILVGLRWKLDAILIVTWNRSEESSIDADH